MKRRSKRAAGTFWCSFFLHGTCSLVVRQTPGMSGPIKDGMRSPRLRTNHSRRLSRSRRSVRTKIHGSSPSSSHVYQSATNDEEIVAKFETATMQFHVFRTGCRYAPVRDIRVAAAERSEVLETRASDSSSREMSKLLFEHERVAAWIRRWVNFSPNDE